MKLEASLKHFSPQGMHISDDVKSTSPNRLNGTDIMTGIGVTSSRARFGLAAFFGKAGISKTDEQLAVQALARHAIDTAPKNVRKHPGIFDADGVEVKAPKIRNELVKRVCGVCGGKKVIHARCRCSGKGEVLDRKATKELGAPVFKTCERCSGNGFSVVPSATVHRAILKRLPDLHQSSWSRNWKPFYEGLVDMLHKGERQAAAEFEKATIY